LAAALGLKGVNLNAVNMGRRRMMIAMAMQGLPWWPMMALPSSGDHRQISGTCMVPLRATTSETCTFPNPLTHWHIWSCTSKKLSQYLLSC
jgi:hypothetical protein